jgi:hypothetical protein
MSKQEKQSSELTPFEASLAGLKPRVEGFDRERLIFLAGQASVLRERGDTPAVKGTAPFLLGRWGWPAAFSAMTAIAATLLVMVCTRPTASVAIGGPKDAASGLADKTVAGNVPDSHSRSELPVPSDPREAEFADAPFTEADPTMRAELRLHRMEFGWPRAAASNSPVVVAEAPLTYFELLSGLQGQGPAGQGGLKEMMQ